MVGHWSSGHEALGLNPSTAKVKEEKGEEEGATAGERRGKEGGKGKRSRGGKGEERRRRGEESRGGGETSELEDGCPTSE